MDYAIDFIPIGNSNGDAICIRYGNVDVPVLWTDIIDGGFSEIGDKLIEHMLTYYGSTNVANMLLTHADDDHARGLIKVLDQCQVGALYMNRPWLFVDDVLPHFHGNYTRQGLIDRFRDMHPYLVDLEDIANRKRVPIFDAFQGTTVGHRLILAPSRQRYIDLIPDLDKTPTSYRASSPFQAIVQGTQNALNSIYEFWGMETLEEYPDPTSASNETCVVQLARYGTYTALFTADAGPKALHEAADFAAACGLLAPPDFFQIPHQGSRRNVTPTVLNRWLGPPLSSESDAIRGWSGCSVGANKTSHPRKRVSNALKRRGYPTQLGRGFLLMYESPALKKGFGPVPIVPFHSDVSSDDQ